MKHAGAAGHQMSLLNERMKISWQDKRGMRWEQLRDLFFVHGGNDLVSHKTPALIDAMRADLTDMLRSRVCQESSV
ncbi:hypothetical protein XELAEV_18031756mg [Xenopus laevis]|uniref:Uncharacterized protein n=1 Tax=Xenopus laevis TaxID=8355 RepID=A0A974CNC1_XENLA|nr:hypothetical protein XELAEV_18031756mg [Xenopus laevis]